MADTETEAGGSFIMNNRGHASHSAQVASEQERFISEETSTTEVMVRPKLLYPKYYKNLIGSSGHHYRKSYFLGWGFHIFMGKTN